MGSFWQEGVRGGYTRTGEGGQGTPLVLQKTGEEDMTILVTAQVLQRRGFVIGTGRGLHYQLRGQKNNIYFKMNAKTFTFPVLARNICWSLSSTAC